MARPQTSQNRNSQDTSKPKRSESTLAVAQRKARQAYAGRMKAETILEIQKWRTTLALLVMQQLSWMTNGEATVTETTNGYMFTYRGIATFELSFSTNNVARLEVTYLQTTYKFVLGEEGISLGNEARIHMLLCLTLRTSLRSQEPDLERRLIAAVNCHDHGCPSCVRLLSM